MERPLSFTEKAMQVTEGMLKVCETVAKLPIEEVQQGWALALIQNALKNGGEALVTASSAIMARGIRRAAGQLVGSSDCGTDYWAVCVGDNNVVSISFSKCDVYTLIRLRETFLREFKPGDSISLGCPKKPVKDWEFKKTFGTPTVLSKAIGIHAPPQEFQTLREVCGLPPTRWHEDHNYPWTEHRLTSVRWPYIASEQRPRPDVHFVDHIGLMQTMTREQQLEKAKIVDEIKGMVKGTDFGTSILKAVNTHNHPPVQIPELPLRVFKLFERKTPADIEVEKLEKQADGSVIATLVMSPEEAERIKIELGLFTWKSNCLMDDRIKENAKAAQERFLQMYGASTGRFGVDKPNKCIIPNFGEDGYIEDPQVTLMNELRAIYKKEA